MRVRKIRFVRLVVTLALVLGSVVSLASRATAAGRPVDVTLTMVLSQGVPEPGQPPRSTNVGTWAASGAITDAGAVTEHLQLKFNKDFTNIVYSVLQEDLSSQSGTITIRIVVQDGFTFISETRIQFEGDWAIASGTGVYVSLSGHGTAVIQVDFALAGAGQPSNFASLSGVASVPL